MRLLKGLFIWLTVIGCCYGQSFKSEILTLNNHSSHLITWGDTADHSKQAIILLSGPIDSWHSDSAWWATIGKSLSSNYRVFALDRAGQVTAKADANVGYIPFSEDVHALIQKYQLKKPIVVAFASSNLTVMKYLQDHHQSVPLKAVAMIDPDVLTEFSIGRYSADAEPFKQNLKQYLDYIGEGKYVARVEQKNAADRALIERLAPSGSVEWPLVDKMLAHRLEIVNQQNQFREIAIYGEELKAVADIPWPGSLPLMVIDTQFEQKYIDANTDPVANAEAIDGLKAWKADGKAYYKALVGQSEKGQYIEVESKAHLYQVEQPETFMKVLNAFLSPQVPDK